jgi:glucose dehydrogenase
VAFSDGAERQLGFRQRPAAHVARLADRWARGKVLTQAAKNGFFYAIDRVTGQFISAFPFVKVNWARGLDDSGRPMVNPEAYNDVEPVAVYPTGGGAHNWAPMSFNPDTGLVYIPASYSSYTYQRPTNTRKAATAMYARALNRARSRRQPSVHRRRTWSAAACRPGIR